MRFGLIEVRLSPEPALTTSSVGFDALSSDRALPERTEDREVRINLLFEKVGHSVLRNRDVLSIPVKQLPRSDLIVPFPIGEVPETDSTMEQRVNRFIAGTLRSGEWFRGVQATGSVIEQRYLMLDLDDVKDDIFPSGASDLLVQALRSTIETHKLPQPSISPQHRIEPLKVALRLTNSFSVRNGISKALSESAALQRLTSSSSQLSSVRNPMRKAGKSASEFGGR
jgi:hypothetical protein